MTPEQFLNSIKIKQRDFEMLINRTLPIKIGVLAKAHFQENFEKGGFVDNGLNKWKKANRLLKGKTGAPSNYKTLLSSRNHLFSSISYVPGNAQVKIINPVEYAKIHNEGGTINIKEKNQVIHFNKKGRFNSNNDDANYAQKVKVGAHSFTMPKRQFIGKSHELEVKADDKIDSEIRLIIHK